MLNQLKGAFKSRVIWFNVVTSALEIANLFAPVVPPGTLLPINVAGNIVLRFLTSQSLNDLSQGRQ